jgi:hypothetical protein
VSERGVARFSAKKNAKNTTPGHIQTTTAKLSGNNNFRKAAQKANPFRPGPQPQAGARIKVVCANKTLTQNTVSGFSHFNELVIFFNKKYHST